MNAKEIDTLTHHLSAEQLKRRAILYLRKSTPETAVSLALQQSQVALARAYGWPEHLIEVIAEDTGKGGLSADDRTGWQRMLAEIVNNAVGIVLATSISRLSRDVLVYEQLRSLAADHGTLPCIRNQISDPSDGFWRDHQ